jgi:DNA-binding beta-propeller fold protein YncE
MDRIRLILGALSVAAMILAGCARPFAVRYVGGLNQPRGLIADDAGNLWVAETGSRTPGDAGNVSPETNHSGRVLRITPQRQKITHLDGLPYTYYQTTGDVGTADIALLGDTLYVLTGEGYDDALSRKVLRAQPGGTVQPVADLLLFALGTATSIDQVIGSVTSNPYAMIAAPDGNGFYVSDGASGRILYVGVDGDIRVFAELPGQPPLTGLAFDPSGLLHVAQFSLWPHTPGSGEIWAADAQGNFALAVEGLTMPIDLAFDASGALLVLEFADGRDPEHPYAPQSGRLLRVEEGGSRTVLIDRLNYPTGFTIAPGGDLYLATGGAFTPAGQGAILKVRCAALGTRCP